MGVPTPILQGIAIGAPIAGGIAGARGARAQGDAAAQAAEFNARLGLSEAGREANRIRREGRRTIGRARTQLAQGGVQAVGSPLEFLAAQAAEIERQAIDTLTAGKNTAALDRSRGANAQAAGRRQAGTSLLLGATRAAGVGAGFLRRS